MEKQTKVVKLHDVVIKDINACKNLPAAIRKKAVDEIKQMIKDRETNGSQNKFHINDLPYKPGHSLSNLFIWSISPSGSEFWEDVNASLHGETPFNDEANSKKTVEA